MFPTILSLGPIKLHSYGLMIALGFLLALHFFQRDAKKEGVDPEVMGTIAFWSLILGIIGTRIAYILMFPNDEQGNYLWSNPASWFAVWEGGLVFQGAIPLVVPYIWYMSRKHKLRFVTLADIVLPYVPLAHAFGRMGCFLNGCCYGRQTDSFLSMCFPKDSPAYLDQIRTLTKAIAQSTPADRAAPRYQELCDQLQLIEKTGWSLPVYPTQLFGVVGLVCFCALLLYLRKHWHPFKGFLFPVYFVVYGGGRVVVEFFRGDHNPTVGPLSYQQIFAVLCMLFGVALFEFMRRRSLTAGASAPVKAKK